MNKNVVFSIVSVNYLSYARTLYSSLCEVEDDSDFLLIVCDDDTPENVERVEATGLPHVFLSKLPINNHRALAFKYDVVELNTAIKPSVFLYLMEMGYKKLIYLDPDIRVYSPLDLLWMELDSSESLVTPHENTPCMDGLRSSDIDFLKNGVYNLGFIAFRASESTREFIGWWRERCLYYGFNDLAFGTFVDQKWVNFITCFLDDVKILKHAGCNVAYWNLHERQLARAGSGWSVNGVPLVFFHFSGVKADDSKTLSKHQNRHGVNGGDVLGLLLSEYCEELIRHGWADLIGLQYGYGSFTDGSVVPRSARRASAFLYEASMGDPFQSGGRLHQLLLDKGVLSGRGSVAATGKNAMNLDQEDIRIRMVTSLLKASIRVFGIERVQLLLDYLRFVSRESNLARVAFGRKFHLAHDEMHDSKVEH